MSNNQVNKLSQDYLFISLQPLHFKISSKRKLEIEEKGDKTNSMSAAKRIIMVRERCAPRAAWIQ